MKRKGRPDADGMHPEYEFDYAEGVRGKYSRRRPHLVVLEPDVAKAFPTSEAVNQALRSLLELAASTRRAARPRSSRPRRAAQR
ncbi:MAG TPA: hypothetical protein VFV75_01855 [Candidatus Polarisedimenticolaceae bacterium]|nr:hypothetical protein [Candidatus Polarisedimenticolaceae bacterium]